MAENKKYQKLFEFCAAGDRIGLADYIITSGCNPSAYDVRDSAGKTALHIACQHGHLFTVRSLIEIFGCRPAAKDNGGNLPIHDACLYGQLDVLDYLLRLVKDSSAPSAALLTDNDGNNLLHKACQSGSVSTVRYIQQILCYPKKYTYSNLNLYLDSTAPYRISSKQMLSTCNRKKLIKCLLSKNVSEDTPLHVACRHGHVNILKVFRSYIPFTGHLQDMLLIAAQCNYRNILNFLVNGLQAPHFLNFNSESINYTPPITSKRNSLPQRLVVDPDSKYLVCNHCKKVFHTHNPEDFLTGRFTQHCCVSPQLFPVVNAPSPESMCNFSCTQCKTVFSASCLENLKCKNCFSSNLKLLMNDIMMTSPDTGTVPIFRPVLTKTPLHALAMSGNAELYKQIFKISPSDDKSLVHAACISDNVTLVTDVMDTLKCATWSQKHNTPLHTACEWGSNKVFTLLTSSDEKKSMVRVINEHGETPLSLATKYNRQELCIELLANCRPELSHSLSTQTLHYACRNNSLELVKMICESDQKIAVNSIDSYGDTPIFSACRCGNLEMVQYLITKGANPSLINDKTLEAPIHIICRMGWSNILKVFLPVCPKRISSRNVYGARPIQLAIESGCFEAVKTLVKLGHFDVNHTLNDKQETLIHFACQAQHIGLCQALLQQPSVNWNAQDMDGNTALHVACRNETMEIAQLIVNVSSITAQNKKGETSVHIATRKMNVSLLSILLNRYSGSLDSYVDSNGDSALHIACQVQDSESAFMIVSLLSKYYSTIVQNKNLETPLHVASRTDNAAVIEHVLNLMPGFALVLDQNQNSPLHLAVEVGSLDIIRLLLPHSSPTCKNIAGETPIHFACTKRKVDIVQALLANCSECVVTNEGNTYLHTACASNAVEVVVFLLEKSGLNCRSLSVPNKQGNSPFHYACLEGNTKIILYLARYSPYSTQSLNEKGFTPLGCLLQNNHDGAFKIVLSCPQIDPVKWCIEPILHFLMRFPFSSDIIERVSRLVQFVVKGEYCDLSQCDSNGKSVLHTFIEQLNTLWRKDIDSYKIITLWKYLLSKSECCINKQDQSANTPLHKLCMIDVVMYRRHKSLITVLFRQLLSCENIKESLVSKNKNGKTPIQLLANQYPLTRLLIQYGANPQDVYKEFKTILDKFKTQHPLNPAMKIFVLGNSTAGKTTLIKALLQLEENVSVSSVEGPTAGIESSKHTSEDYGCVIYHDFAGQPEFESSNSAFLENCFQSYAESLTQTPIFLLLVDVSKRSLLEKHVQYWFTYIKNHTPQQLETPPHVIIIGSHSDCIQASSYDSVLYCINIAAASINSLNFEVFGPILLDCREVGTSQMKNLKTLLTKSCSSLRVTVEIDCRCHILFAYLSKWFKSKTAVKLSDIQEKIKSKLAHEESANYPSNFRPHAFRKLRSYKGTETHDSLTSYYPPEPVSADSNALLLPIAKESLLDLLRSLHLGGHLLLLNHGNAENCWIVMDNDLLFATVNGTLFAPESFSLPKLKTNTGVVSEEMLRSLFKGIDINLVTEFTVYSEFCQIIEDKETLLLLLQSQSECVQHSASIDMSSPQPNRKTTNPLENCSPLSDNPLREQHFYFFPGLVKYDRSHLVWKHSEENSSYSFGWYLLCNQKHFLDPRFLHVLLLRLTFNFAAVNDSHSLQSGGLNRKCKIWRNGIQWSTRRGVEVLVEVIEQNTAVLLLMRSIKEHEMESIKLRSEVIKKILDTKDEFCPNVKMTEYLLPRSSTYPQDSDLELKIPISEVAQAICNADSCVIDSNDKPYPLKTLLYFDPYLQIGRDTVQKLWMLEKCNEEVSTDFLLELSQLLHIFLHQITKFLGVPESDVEVHRVQWGKEPVKLLLHIFESWKVRQENPSYDCLRQLFDSQSIFCGRNPLELITQQCAQKDQYVAHPQRVELSSSQTEESGNDLMQLDTLKKLEDESKLDRVSIKHLMVITWHTDETTKHKLHILRDVSSSWETIARNLQIEPLMFDSDPYHRQRPRQECATDLFKWWLDHQDKPLYPKSWSGLCELLHDSNLQPLARKVSQVICSPSNSVLRTPKSLVRFKTF